MGPAAPQPTLNHLRQTLAGIDPSNAPRLAGEERLIGIAAPIDRALGGGLACGALHELAPAAPLHLGAASGFALALAARASGDRRQVLWIATDFAAGEAGALYGPGLDLFGLATARLLVLRVPRPVDALLAMEEALKCRALACVIAELPATARGRSHRDAAALARRARGRARSASACCAPPHHVDAERGATRWQIARSRPSLPR